MKQIDEQFLAWLTGYANTYGERWAKILADWLEDYGSDLTDLELSLNESREQ